MLIMTTKRPYSYHFKEYCDWNLYSVLNLTKDATHADIKKAYYELAKRYHPDGNHTHDDPISKSELKEKFLDIQLAYDIL